MTDMQEIGKRARAAARDLVRLDTEQKNRALLAVAKAICDNTEIILEANKKDIENAKKNNMRPAMLDRLTLDDGRVKAMAEGVSDVAKLSDPIGEVIKRFERPNGLSISMVRVPIGVIGIVYESRPNVTSDAFAITFKTGNACILRGGSDSVNSVNEICKIIRNALEGEGINPDCVQTIEDTDRKYVTEMLHLTEYIDLIIPRGSDRLISHVVENSTVPVIRTGTGNNHVYVDESADLNMAVEIVNNAKTQRVSVCNALESVVVHSSIANEFIPLLARKLSENNVEMRGDERAAAIDSSLNKADESDWDTEYLDYIIAVKTVDSLDEAIDFINLHNTGHSDAIVTASKENAQRFLREIDSACVYVNASTRFTDGGEFGFGAEIGISTQKIHARGPMGLEQMTSVKYEITGDGQIR